MKEETVTFAPWDPADYIETPEDVAAHLECAPEENDIDFLEKTIGHIARSKGMAQIARELHIDRLDSIHRLPKAAAHLSLR